MDNIKRITVSGSHPVYKARTTGLARDALVPDAVLAEEEKKDSVKYMKCEYFIYVFIHKVPNITSTNI
jgi:hypothetical protein